MMSITKNGGTEILVMRDSRVSGVGHLWGILVRGVVKILVNNGILPVGVTQQFVPDFQTYSVGASQEIGFYQDE